MANFKIEVSNNYEFSEVFHLLDEQLEFIPSEVDKESRSFTFEVENEEEGKYILSVIKSVADVNIANSYLVD